MTVFTYFDADSARPGDGEMLRLWKTSWERRGWTPKILTPRSAMPHKRYAEFVEHVKDMDPQNRAGRMRWLALAAVGGGWLSRFDVINFSFRPVTPKESVRAYWGLMWLKPRSAQKIVQQILEGQDAPAILRAEAVVYGNPGWETAPLVWFADYGWQTVAKCSRKF